MKLQLRPGRPEDVPEFVSTTMTAFSTNMIHQRCLPPSSETTQHFWRSALEEEIHDPNARFVVVEDVETTPPTFVAFAKWDVVAENTPYPAPPEEIWPKDADVALAVKFFGKLVEMHEKIMGSQAHWYLEMVGTKQEYQGKGAGGMLVKWGVDRAEEVGWPCYLDATPDGKSLYKKLGFRELETLEFLDGQYKQCFMVRDANLSAGA